MLRTAIAGLAICWPLAASAAFQCAIGADRCKAVYAELQRHFDAEERDRFLYRHLTPGERSTLVIERKHDRLVKRLKTLPKDIGDEFARLLLCDSIDRREAAMGGRNRDRRCADQD